MRLPQFFTFMSVARRSVTRAMFLFVFALIAALMLALPSGVARAAYSVTLNSAYCQNTATLNGTWSGSTCTIPSGTTGTIPSGDHVYTYGDNTNGFLQIHVSSGATLVVAGALALYGGASSGSMVNDGTVTVNATGQIDVNSDSADTTRSGWLKNNSGATLTNNGILNVNTSSGATAPCAGSGRFDNLGTFINNVTLANYSPCFTNSGTMTNNGEYTNGGGKFDIQAGTVTNSASIHLNSGQVIVGSSLVISNTGTIWLGNDAGSQAASLWLSAGNTTFTNNGHFYVNSLSWIASDSSNPVTNNGTIQSSGDVQVDYMTNASGSVYVNDGTFTIRQGASNAGQFDNNTGGTVTNQNSAYFTNQNLFNNSGTFVNSIWAHLANNSGATIENHGAVKNDSYSYVANSGTINDYCGCTFTIPTSPYFTGNQPVNYCVPPAFTSVNHTAFVIGQAETFAVTTSGMPIPSLSRTGTLPSGVTFADNGNGTGTLAGTPALGTTGSYSLTLTASSVVAPTATQPFTLTVNRANTVTTLTSSANPSTYGNSVTITATVAPSAAPGTVQFYADSAPLGSAVTLSSGQAMTTTALLVAGTHTITATYTGNTNYNPSTSSNLLQTVNKKTLTASITAANKTYDGTTTAAVTRTLSGIVGSDNVTVTITAANFADRNVGAGKTVTATGLALSGTAKDNYTVNTTATTTASITPRTLTVGATGIDRVYNGTTAATVTLSDNRVSGDTLTTIYASASFADPNVGNSKTVNVSDISVTGTDAGNYIANTTATTTANITRHPLTVTADNQSSAYGSPDPTFTFQYVGFVNGETATVLTTPPTCGVSGSHTAVGTYPIACSGGVAQNYAFTYVNGTLTVTLADTTTTLTSSPNPSSSGQVVSLTATVAPAAAAGSVQFYADGAPLGSQVSLSGGSAITSTSSLTVGTHPITATYSGSTNYNASTSNQINQQVLCLNSITVSNANNSGAGSLRDALAKVCSGGTITFGGDYTIRLASTLSLDKNVTIDGAGRNVTISGDKDNNGTGDVQVFYVPTGTTANLQNLTLTKGNCFGCNGGAIQNRGSLTVSNSTLSDNSAPNAGGGGIYNWGATLTLNNDTFVGNSTNGNGGAVASSGQMTVTNSTFVGNSALDGGAISTSGTLTMTNSTLSGNNATQYLDAGGIRNGGTLTIRNSIITKGSAGRNCTGIIGGSNNLADDAYCGVGFTNSPSILLGTLGSYGGSTETIPLLPGSSAMNATSTNCPTTDQRGVARGSTCDLGAFESQGFTLGSLTGTPQSTARNTAFATPLGLTVSSSHGEPVSGGKVTFAPPGTGASAVITGSPATIAANGRASVTVTANGTFGSYNVTASAAGAATSAQFALTNTGSAPSVTTQPSDQTVCEGGQVTFSSAATGDPTPSVQWQVLPIGGTWSVIGGMTNPTLTFTPSAAANGNQYRAVYSNIVGSATTNAATLTVNIAPAVTTHPSNVTVNAGTLASFAAAASGRPTPNVQWQVSSNGGATWDDIAGATSTTYAFTPTLSDSWKQYRAVFSSPAGCGSAVTTKAATLTVNNAAPTLTSISPTSAKVNSPGLTLTVTGTNFVASSVVRWNGSNRTTTYISNTKLTAAITTGDLSAEGTATVTVYTPAPGGGTSIAVQFAINSMNSAVSLTSSCNPCRSNQPLTFTGTVTNIIGGSTAMSGPRLSSNAVPGGTMTFKKNGTDIPGCAAVALNGAGQAVCTTTLTGGTHTITANYSGNANFKPALGTLTQYVNYVLFLPNIRK